jgi:hypothetical protein
VIFWVVTLVGLQTDTCVSGNHAGSVFMAAVRIFKNRLDNRKKLQGGWSHDARTKYKVKVTGVGE